MVLSVVGSVLALAATCAVLLPAAVGAVLPLATATLDELTALPLDTVTLDELTELLSGMLVEAGSSLEALSLSDILAAAGSSTTTALSALLEALAPHCSPHWMRALPFS